MILKTERLILRPWKEADAEELYKYAKDPRVGPIAGWPVHTDIENSRQIIKEVLSDDETYAVVLKDTGMPIGSIGIILGEKSNIALGKDEGEVGYWVGVPYWGQGLIPEAVNEILRYGFEELGLKVIWCGYFEGNEKSRRVQEKCGFQYHHTVKDIEWPLMNDIRTEHFTCISKEQWKANLNTDNTLFHGKAYKYLKGTILLIYVLFMLIYVFREGLYKLDNYYITLLAETAPNLIPSFLFTLIGIFYVVPKLFKTTKAISNSKYVWLINILNMSIFALIEYLHVLFNLGVWDNRDMAASLIGIIVATIIYFKSRKLFVNKI